MKNMRLDSFVMEIVDLVFQRLLADAQRKFESDYRITVGKIVSPSFKKFIIKEVT